MENLLIFSFFAIAINLHEGSRPMAREVVANSTTLSYRLITTYMEAAFMRSSYGEMTFLVARGRHYYRKKITPESAGRHLRFQGS